MMLKILDFTLGAVGGRGGRGISFQSVFAGKQNGLERVVKIDCLNIGTICTRTYRSQAHVYSV
jgi:hypothetical protein